MPREIRLALDRDSARRIDDDGHLHVSASNISKATVNGYRGAEIPDGDKLGLDPNRVYQLLRDPDELAKGAKSFEGKPLLSIHRPTTATDHAHRLTVGSIGHPVTFDGTYLKAPLTVWDGDAIAGIENREQHELSSGYRYDADMRPGMFKGQKYDGVMRNIRANHVALVSEGRAGPDVVVGDAALVLNPSSRAAPRSPFIVEGNKPMVISRAALLASGALRTYLAPKLATDKKIDLGPILRGVSKPTWRADKARIKTALDNALAGKLAADAEIADVVEMLDQLDQTVDDLTDDPKPMAEPNEPVEDDDADATARVREFLSDKLSPEDLDSVMTLLKPEVDPGATDANTPPINPENGLRKDLKPANISKPAMDAAIRIATDRAARDAETRTVARMNAIREAERIVRPLIGELSIAQDSAEAVFRLALDQAEVDVEGVPATAYGAMVKMVLKQRAETPHVSVRPRLAQDTAADAQLLKQFPGLAKLKAR